MLKPVRMKLANVLMLKEDLKEATRALAESECLQVEEPVVVERDASMRRMDTRGHVSRLAQLKARIEAVATVLHARGDGRGESKPADLRVSPRSLTSLVESEFGGLEKETQRLALTIGELKEKLARVDLTAWLVSALEQRRIDPELVGNPRYIRAQMGTLPGDAFARVRESMALAGHETYSMGSIGARTLVFAVTTPERFEDMRKGLRSARFERLDIRRDLVSEGRFDAQAAEVEMWETRESLTEAGLELEKLKRERTRDVGKWLAEIELNLRMLGAMENFIEGEYTCLVTGWVPAAEIEGLEARLAKRCSKPVEVSVLSEETMTREGLDGLKPPTQLKNAGIVRPFEMIVNLYGTPAYNSIDPTPIVAVTFVVMFGAMFGDVGHGGVLALIGLAAFLLGGRKSTGRDLGGVLIGCGLSSMVFGVLYGSVFGYEHILDAVWTRPMENPAKFLSYGVILGAVVINLGLAINVVQKLTAGKIKDALFGEWGASTLAFYWAAIFLFYLVTTGRGGGLSWGLVALLLAPPLLVTAFGSMVVDMVMKRESEEDITGAVFRPIELMLASLTNTISFVRVPAFALNHAALMAAVFLMAEVFSGPGGGGGFASTANIIVGNMVVVALEGLIVFVQAMRLHYYEFFGKFFHQIGRPFAPLAIEEGRRGV